MLKNGLNIKKIAMESLAVHPIIGQRAKISTHEIVGKKLTIEAFGFATVNNSRYAIIRFKEMPEYYYSAGLILTKMCDSIANAISDSPDFYDAESGIYDISDVEAIVIELSEERTSDGSRNLTKVSIVD